MLFGNRHKNFIGDWNLGRILGSKIIFRVFPSNFIKYRHIFLLWLFQWNTVLFIHVGNVFLIGFRKDIVMLKVNHVRNETNFSAFQKSIVVLFQLIHWLHTFFLCFAECITFLSLSSVCVIQGLALLRIWILTVKVLIVLSLRSLVGLRLKLCTFFHAVLIHRIDDGWCEHGTCFLDELLVDTDFGHLKDGFSGFDLTADSEFF